MAAQQQLRVTSYGLRVTGYERVHIAVVIRYKAPMAARKLRVLGHCEDLVEAIYRASSRFPADERFGLTSQMRRAAISVGSNIAEGSETTRPGEFGRYLSIALASLAELDHQTGLARRVGYLDEDSSNRIHSAITEIRRMVVALRRSIRSRHP